MTDRVENGNGVTAIQCKRGCGNAVHRGSCKRPRSETAAPKRKYVRRKKASNEAVGRKVKGATFPAHPEPATGDLAKLETLRAQIQDQYDQAETVLARLAVKLETYDEIMGVLA